MNYWAHSSPDGGGDFETFEEHNRCVVEQAVEFATPLGFVELASLVAVLHDVGKLSELFSRRLSGLEAGLDHWSAGAALAVRTKIGNSLVAGVVIQGHHIGLQIWPVCRKKELQQAFGLEGISLTQASPSHLRVTESDIDLLLQRLHERGFSYEKWTGDYKFPQEGDYSCSLMLDVRMLFSCLVDADFLATEAHFAADAAGSKKWRETAPILEPDRAFLRLSEYVQEMQDRAVAQDVDTELISLRSDLWEMCLGSGSEDSIGCFTLSAPTGTGKTLAMLGFALQHARRHGLRRIIFVIPFLSIIDQTARIYREVFSEAAGFPAGYVLEDHSLARPQPSAEEVADNDDIATRRRLLLSDNWDAPIILTTSVKALESLFANRPGACRKLHRMAESVILFDEVQTLPAKLTVPTLATLSRLSDRFRSSVVFATATQPAFDHLDCQVRKLASSGWTPRPIRKSGVSLFGDRSRRVSVEWPKSGVKTEWGEIAEAIVANRQGLCIVNLRDHARHLFRLVKEKLGGNPDTNDEGVFHLSTSMCSAHRLAVIEEVTRRLKNEMPCRLISTQCVEAGVDLDFPRAWRAMAPLEAIAQAAGRCNRRGRLPADQAIVTVFTPVPLDGQKVLYPPGAYKEAAEATESILLSKGSDFMDIDDEETFRRYYRYLYDITKSATTKERLGEALTGRDFVRVAREYRLIDQDTINVIVCYEPLQDLFRQLSKEADDGILTGSWMGRAKPLTVGMIRPRGKNSDDLGTLLAVPLSRRPIERSNDWFVADTPGAYDRWVGLSLEAGDFIVC